MAVKNYKISFCVVCMNRLHQLKQTLLQNIQDNADYPDLEFIVLDYNSEDGLEDWAKENLYDYIENGRVIYYKTNDPKAWSPSHSKNLAFKLATGDIVCSIWADYYTGAGFADYVNRTYKQNDNIVLTPIDFYKTKKNHAPPGDVLGKVAVKKTDFLKIKGFDERMNKHGFEDYDFINRLEMIGVRRVIIEDHIYLQYIKHDNAERYLLPTDNLHGMYVNYLTPASSEVIFMYKDARFDKGILIDNYNNDANNYSRAYRLRNEHFEYSLKDCAWQTGTWSENDNGWINFSSSGHDTFTIKGVETGLRETAENLTFYTINDTDVINEVLTFKHFYDTRSLMEESLKNQTAIVNKEFGNATAFKNFSLTPISII